MKFSISREVLLHPLQLILGVVNRRQTLPILANVLLSLEDKTLLLVGTDLEVEIVMRLPVGITDQVGETTLSAKKLSDICRSLPGTANIDFTLQDSKKMILKSGRSRFTLATLPANNFPKTEKSDGDLHFLCPQHFIKRLINKTSFAMAQQDVRYYLNGMLWEVEGKILRCVATDGHRLAMCVKELDIGEIKNKIQSILPRKGVIELSRLLTTEEAGLLSLTLGSQHIRVETANYRFTSKLIDGKFPDYQRVLPAGGSNVVLGNRLELKQAFVRTAILSNEKYRGVSLNFSTGLLKIVANNREQEEAEEHLVIEYEGDSIEVGFNVSYLQDISSILESENIKITLSDANNSVLLEGPEENDSIYVVMPMRL